MTANGKSRMTHTDTHAKMPPSIKKSSHMDKKRHKIHLHINKKEHKMDTSRIVTRATTEAAQEQQENASKNQHSNPQMQGRTTRIEGTCTQMTRTSTTCANMPKKSCILDIKEAESSPRKW